MRLVQVAVRATDLERASQFYARLLGTPEVARFDPPGLLFFDLDGTRLLLDAKAPSSLIYLHVPDVRASVEEVREFAEVTTEPHAIFEHEDDKLGPAGTVEWQAFITDPDGNTVGLVSFQRPD
jgi:methylmalonyl-CoA/ethylmalonyl-CoA epimerase